MPIIRRIMVVPRLVTQALRPRLKLVLHLGNLFAAPAGRTCTSISRANHPLTPAPKLEHAWDAIGDHVEGTAVTPPESYLLDVVQNARRIAG